MDSMPSAVAEHVSIFFSWIKNAWNMSVHFVNILPPVVRFIIHAAFYLSILGIILTQIRAMFFNRDKWKEKYNSGLTFSYFRGTGQYQRRYIYRDAHNFLSDRTWLLLSAAGVAYHLGIYESDSKLRLFLLSFIHIPLTVIGFIEMVFRVVFGTIYLWIASIIHGLLLIILKIVTLIVTPFFNLIDKAKRNEQHCTYCYRSFKVPGYVCPSCGKIHKDLVPGDTGILTARCGCGKFLPCSLISGRSRLESVCPECEKPLAATGAREFTLQLIGGDTSGKSAFLASFQHLYRMTGNADNVKIEPFPKEEFDALEKMFMTGNTSESSKTSIVTYSMVHKYEDGFKDTLVVYDVPDEVLISGVYEQNPLNFGYTDGVLIIIDPTTIKAVRNESEKNGQMIPDNSFADNEANAEDVIIEFIQQFSRLSNRSSNKMIKIPVAVIINKADLKAVKNKIGLRAIEKMYQSNPAKFNDDINIARNTACRNYMISIGMANTINNLESVFSKVQYFPSSAMGHMAEEGTPFSPFGVIEPIGWIASQNNVRFKDILAASSKIVGEDSFEDVLTAKALLERYKKAEKFLSDREFGKAYDEFMRLGNYRDAQERAKTVTAQCYSYAKRMFEGNNFDEAAKQFTAIKDYKDSADYAAESLYQYGKILVNEGKYKRACDCFKRLGNYKDTHSKYLEVRYLIAKKEAEQGNPKVALDEYNKLGDYKDAKQNVRLLFPKLIKNGERRNLAFGKYKWRVIRVDKDMALVITETVICQKAYNDTLTGITWRDSSVRKFLNTDFLCDFDDREKRMIFSTMISNNGNPEYGTSGGENTVDAVFLLSDSEMRTLFSSDQDRIPKEGGIKAEWCWLRTPGGNNSYAAIVDSKGAISDGGNTVNNRNGGLRPAMWIIL